MKKDNRKCKYIIGCIVLWFLSIFYYSVILSFSATPALQSSRTSENISNHIVTVVKRISNNTSKNDQRLRETVHFCVRKAAHMINFLIFSFLNSMLFYFMSKKNLRKAMLITLLIGLCGGVLDEISQMFVSGRASRIYDMFVDFTGTVGGCLLFLLLLRNEILCKNEKVIV